MKKVINWIRGTGIVRWTIKKVTGIGIKGSLMHGEQVSLVLSKARPGDIVLVRAFGELTTWLYSVLWMLGLPKTQFTHAAIIIDGEKIADATRNGFTVNSIHNLFIGSSRVCIRRPMMEPSELSMVVTQACHYAEENIDYDFDFTTTNDSFYCSEACWRCLNDARPDFLGLRERFGEWSITPDDIYSANRKFQTIYDSGAKE